MKEYCRPELSVIIPTFNNLPVLKECISSWQRFAQGQPVEIIVIEDGCRDQTPIYLTELAESTWGRRHLRWFHENDVHELKCTNRGFAEATAPLILVWQDDMFLRQDWFVEELMTNLFHYKEIGLLSLSRGLNCAPVDEPIIKWEDLIDWRRLQSTIGKAPFNWFHLQEVDAVIRPWLVRRECLDKVGLLDETFRLSEWDEADLCYRIRRAGWKIATYGYERLGAYHHLGSTTISKGLTDSYKKQVLQNGRLFHQRWDHTISLEHLRQRRTWLRKSNLRSVGWTLQRMLRYAARKVS